MSETKPEIKKNYYMLLIGSHFNAIIKKKYTAGDVISSESDLVAKFGSEKFRKLTKKEIAAMQTDESTTEEPKRKRIKAKRI